MRIISIGFAGKNITIPVEGDDARTDEQIVADTLEDIEIDVLSSNVPDEYDDHLFVDDGTSMHLCSWGSPDATCGDAADSQNHRNDPSVLTTPLEDA